MVECSTVQIQENSKSIAVMVCKPWTWRLSNGFMALFFALAAYVQMNDPDPVIWMMIYGVPCVLCTALVMKSSLQDQFIWKLTAVTHLSACTFAVLYSLSVLLRTEITSKNPLNYEEGREIGGLLIVVSWIVLCLVTRHKSSNETAVYLWTATIAIALIPFVLFGIYITTWDLSSLQDHCKDIISSHLYKHEI